MKAILRIFLATLICFSLFGCGEDTPAPLPNGGQSGSQTTESQMPRGNQVGDLCYSFDVPLVNAEGDTGETLDPSATGRVTVINFWGTWCGPCVSELPHFEEFATNFADKATVLAIHSTGDSNQVPDFIAENYPESSIAFARDPGTDYNGEFFTMMGGNGNYPFTIILDNAGIIRFKQVGTMDYAQLVSVISEFDPSFA